MEEIWKKIKNTNNIYLISNKGRLKTLNWRNSGKEVIMKPAPDKKGYLRTVIIIDNKPKTIKLHRLVAETFINNPENKPQVNHVDCNKQNNMVNNLEWVTPQENFLHSVEHLKQKSFVKNIGKTSNLKHLIGEQIGTSKLTIKEVKEIRNKFIPRVYTRKILANEYNVKESTIKDIILKKSWRWLL